MNFENTVDVPVDNTGNLVEQTACEKVRKFLGMVGEQHHILKS